MSNAKVRARRRRRTQASARTINNAIAKWVVSWDWGVEPGTAVSYYTTTEGAPPGHHFVIFGDRP